MEWGPAPFDDGVPHPEDHPLARGAEPEVTLLLKKADAVLLRLDGIPRLPLEHAEVRDGQPVPRGPARVLRHLAAQLDGGLLRRSLSGREYRLGHVLLRDH